MPKVPCVNTIELNKYLDGLDAADARDDEIMRIASEEVEPEIFDDAANCEEITEAFLNADNDDDIQFLKACILGGYKSQALDDLITVGLESGYEYLAKVLSDHESLPEHAQAIVEEYAQAEALRLAEKELERIERNGPDY